MIGFGIIFFHRPSGIAICIGALASFYLAAFEKRLTAKPVYSDPAIDTGDIPRNQPGFKSEVQQSYDLKKTSSGV
jgi:hypothetical protein